jgi:cell surface protein SprA
VSENYYQYHVRINPSDVNPTNVGSNFIVDAFDGTAEFSGVTKTVKWYQFKIPISQFENNVGGIEGFNSIRFMRVYLRGFDRPVVLRMARFELVRSDWRRYQFDLREPGERIATDNNNTSFDISAVSLQENSTKVPVNYVMPPDIDQQQNVQTTNLVLMNEQALQIRVCDLKDGDSRAIFKNVDLDTRMFKNIKMNVHAEKSSDATLKDGDLNMFFRVGTDYNNNYYEYQVPLKLTPEGRYDPNSTDSRRQVWLPENEVNFKFDEITSVKEARNKKIGYFSDLTTYTAPYSMDMGGYTVTIVGNPNLGTIKSVMVGIRNPTTADKQSHCAEVWINELRLTEFNNKGGWATTGQVQAKLADLGMLNLAGTYKSPYWGSVESKINERSRETNTTWDMSSSINGGKFFPAKWKISLPFFFNYGQTRITPLYNPLDPDVLSSDLQKNLPDSLWKSIRDKTTDFTLRKGFNFTNVRIDGFKRPKAKALPWDIANFNVSYAYNEIRRSNVNLEFNELRTYRGNLQYMYTIKNPYVFKPFSKVKLFQNKWFALLKDFNLQLVPNSMGASVDLNRSYSAVKNRDITAFYANSDGFTNPVLVNKNFIINRNYSFVWSFNKSLKFDFTANNDGRIMENPGEVQKNSKQWRDTVQNWFWHGGVNPLDTGRGKMGRFGENTTYRQQMNLTVDVPLNKFPALDFAKVSYRYSGTYTWLRQPFASIDPIGNTIQNTNGHNVTGSFNMVLLYNKIPYLKRINNPPPKAGGGLKAQAPGGRPNGEQRNKDSERADTTKTNNFKEIGEFLARTLMMLKNVSATYQLQGGQALPNFMPKSQYMGMDFGQGQNQAPGLMFTTGIKDENIIKKSINNHWLNEVQQQTTPYTETFNNTFNYRASVEPHGSLKIEFTGNYTRSYSSSKYIVYDPTAPNKYNDNISPSITGNYNISTFSYFKTFRDGNDPVNSELFKTFLDQRQNMAKQLSDKNPYNNDAIQSYTVLQNTQNGTTVVPQYYYDGYSPNQQDVLLGTFNKVYASKSTSNYDTKKIFPSIPLPNWNLTWDGLSKLSAVKKTFRSITVRHAYRSNYQLGNFSNNVLYSGNDQTTRMPVSANNLSANFVPYYSLNTVTLRESFEPLVKFDFQFVKPGWSANIEAKRDKTTNLNLAGLQIIETKGQEYVIGAGYLYPKLKINKIKIQGKVLESNLTVKVDISYRRNISVIRQIADGVSIPTGGTNIFTMRSSADYQLTPNVALRLFYDWVRTSPQTSASYPTASVNGGFSLRITFQ